MSVKCFARLRYIYLRIYASEREDQFDSICADQNTRPSVASPKCGGNAPVFVRANRLRVYTHTHTYAKAKLQLVASHAGKFDRALTTKCQNYNRTHVHIHRYNRRRDQSIYLDRRSMSWESNYQNFRPVPGEFRVEYENIYVDLYSAGSSSARDMRF